MLHELKVDDDLLRSLHRDIWILVDDCATGKFPGRLLRGSRPPIQQDGLPEPSEDRLLIVRGILRVSRPPVHSEDVPNLHS